ncbi:hypothetical protein DRY71_24175 [Salmonella enterica subsp. enterica serovar Newport]|uniref:Uncharacterized protein n=1 Tax=Salmonella newport TaxID=108619 RepID=A0A5U9KX65_SALNE|nr:hypothetical protein [Salmonella enterica subsp. enterica serovar Newport]
MDARMTAAIVKRISTWVPLADGGDIITHTLSGNGDPPVAPQHSHFIKDILSARGLVNGDKTFWEKYRVSIW